jgi:5'-3' exonuclease
MVKLRDRFPNATFWVAWEGRNSHKMRRDIYAEYKTNRKKESSGEVSNAAGDSIGEVSNSREILYSQIDVLQMLLQAVGVHQVEADGFEADDMIATLVRERLTEDKNIIVSSDRDLLQLVGEGTVQMTPQAEKFFDKFTVEEEYGVPPRLLLSYRTFDGDKSDNMPGMFRFPRKKIARIVTEHDGDLESIYTECKVDLTEFQRKTLTDFESQAAINRDVMALRTIEDYEEREGDYDEEVITRVCNELEIESIRPDLLALKASTGFVKTGESYVGLLHSTS